MSRDTLYVNHILGAIEKISIVLKDVHKEDFAASFLVHDVVIRELEIIGEAAKRLSPEIQGTIKDIPWKEVVGMRNHVTHEYFAVDFDEVWKTVQEDIPSMKIILEKYQKENI